LQENSSNLNTSIVTPELSLWNSIHKLCF